MNRRALLLLSLLVGVWEAYSRLGAVDPLLLPAPSAIASSLWHDRALLADNLVVTGSEIVLGLALALLVGLSAAVAMHLWSPVRDAGYPLLVASQAIPIVAIAPLLAAWFGFGLLPKLVIVALVCFFPITVATLDGLARTDPDRRKLLRSLGATRLQRLRWLDAPSALPAALSGAKIAVAVGGIAAVFAEYAGSDRGLGHLMMQSIPQFETARAWAAVVLIAALALLCFGALSATERLLTPWARDRKDPSR